MNTRTKFMIGASAAIAAAALGIWIVGGAHSPSPASVVADRFVFPVDAQEPAAKGVDLATVRRNAAAAMSALTLPTDVQAPKGARLDIRQGAAADRHDHHVTLQRRTAPSASEATKFLAADVAAR